MHFLEPFALRQGLKHKKGLKYISRRDIKIYGETNGVLTRIHIFRGYTRNVCLCFIRIVCRCGVIDDQDGMKKAGIM